MTGPSKVLAPDAGLEGENRFRFTGLQTRLAQADAHPLSLQAVPTAEADINVDTSHFKTALTELSERNLTDVFTKFASECRPNALSLALVLRARSWLVENSCEALRSAAREQHLALEPIALCVAALARDLGAPYFLPFFPKFVTAFAEIFSGENAAALFWDPELALLPVFSALSAITKVLVAPLVADPDRTLANASPLLGHSHYRVREMTAESCLGYIMRKTRQPDALERLVKAVVDTAKSVSVPEGKQIEQMHIVHGAGAAIFEAMRLPSGGLHSRAHDVLGVALEYTRQNNSSRINGSSEAAATEALEENSRFAIIVHSVARVCCHLKQKPNNVAALVAQIVNHGASGTENGSAEIVADSLFLVRHCLLATSVRGVTVLPDAYVQRVAAFLLSSLKNFPEDKRVCHEAFACFLAVLERAPQQRSHRVLISMKNFLLSSSDTISAESICAVLLSLATLLGKSSKRTLEIDQLLPIVANLSNSLAKRTESVTKFLNREIECGIDIQHESTLVPLFIAFQTLTQFVEAAKQKFVSLNAPDMDRAVVRGLDAAVSVAERKRGSVDVFSAPTSSPVLLQTLLRYTSLVNVPAAAPYLARLAGIPMRPELLAIVASSVLRYETSAFAQTSVDVEENLLSIVRSLLQNIKSGKVSADVISAINVYMVTRKVSRLVEGLPETDLNDVIEVLSSHLSSTEYNVRVECAILLRHFALSWSSDGVPTEVNGVFVADECDACSIRALLGQCRGTVCGDDLVYSAILCVLTTPHELDSIIPAREIMGQLAILTRIPERISARVRTALCHFSVGVFAIRFKPLWEAARNLWSAVAEASNDEAWIPMSSALKSTCHSILSQFSLDRSPKSNPLILDNADSDSDEEEVVEKTMEVDLSPLESHRNHIRNKKRPRHAPFPQSQIEATRKKQRLMQSRGTFVLLWPLEEWKAPLSKQRSITNNEISASSMSLQDIHRNSVVDSLTRHTEYLKVLSQYPKSTLKMRGFIVDELYLKLDPNSLSRRTGNLLIRQYASLMEKMGGLKISENDKSRYQLLRMRLLRDLSRSCPSAQTEVMRCICASRSPELKPFKQSLLRIIDDKTFREEISMLTDTLSLKLASGASESKLKQSRLELSDSMVDVLVRLCYSKTRGKFQKIGARRSAAICFVSALPWKTAIPKLVDLALENMSSFIDKVYPLFSQNEKNFSVDLSSVCLKSPPENVCRGVLKSLESILPELRGCIPPEMWRQICIAVFIILVSSTGFRQGQDLRSNTLKLIALMLEQDPDSTSFLCLPVLKSMSKFDLDVSGAESIISPPAFLKFLAASFRSLSADTIVYLIGEYSLACSWTLQILRSKSASHRTVQFVTEIGHVIVRTRNQVLQESASSTNTRAAAGSCEGLVDTLAASLRIRLASLQDPCDNNWHRNKSKRDSLELIMKLVTEVSSCSELKEDVLLSLADSLLCIITESKLYGPALVSCISAFASLVSRLTEIQSQDTRHVKMKFVPRLVQLFSSSSYAKQLEAKERLCLALANFGDDALCMVSYLVRDTVAMNSSRIGESDLDSRVQAFSSFIKIMKRSLNDKAGVVSVAQSDVEQSKSFCATERTSKFPDSAPCSTDVVLLIVHTALSSVQDEDSSVRGTASYCLQLLAQWVSSTFANQSKVMGSALGDLLVRHSTSNCSIPARREYCRVLGGLVRGLKQLLKGNLVNHCSDLLVSLFFFADVDNIETDFFENVVHLQVHRRSRAMRRLVKKLEESLGNTESVSTLLQGVRDFIFPLSMRIALDVSEVQSTNSARRSKEAKEAHLRDVTTAAISLNNAAACFLPWQDYRREVVWIIRRISKETDDSSAEVLYSLLVGFSGAFPGTSVGQCEETSTRSAQERFLRTYILPKMTAFITSGAVEGEVDVTLNNSKAKKTSSGDRSLNSIIFRAPVAIAVAKLISQLDDKELNNRMPSLINPLASALRSREPSIRAVAKKTLVDVVLLLDPKFFSYTVDQVLWALVNGYRKDTVVYVIHALLCGIRDHRLRDVNGKNAVFTIDSSAKKLCDALAEELEDGLHASRTDYINPNATGTRLKKATHRALRVNDAAELLGELINFSQSADIVLQPFVERLIGASSSKLSARLNEAVQKLVLGFSRNKSVSPDDGLKLAFRLITSHMPTPNLSAIDQENDESTAALQNQLLSLMKDRTFSNAPNAHIVAELGWQLLNSLMKNLVDPNGSSAEHRKTQAMLEPFVPEVLLSMRSRYDSLTHIALKCAQRLLRAPISGRAEVADVMAATTVDVLCKNLGVSINPGAPMAVSSLSKEDSLFCTCLRASAVLVQEVGYSSKRGIKKERVESLLKIARNVLDQNSVEARSAALVLIRSTVSARIHLPDVYDTVEHVSKLAVRAQSSSLRTSCANIAVRFLVNFPLGAKRVRQHLEFFVRNLSYELPHGRVASIGILVAIIEKLPEKNLEEECEYFFVSLVSVIARDNELQCRKAAAAAVETLFSTIENGRSFSILLNMCQSLLGKNISAGDDEKETVDCDILRSGAIALSSAAKSKKLSKSQLESSLVLLVSALSGDALRPWESVHAMMCCLENLLEAQADDGNLNDALELQVFLKPFWDCINTYLLHRHEWIRLVSARVLGRHLSAAGGREAAVSNENANLYSVFWTRNGVIRELLKTLCLQFEAKQLSDDLAKQSLKNILCLANLVWKCPAAGNVCEEKMNRHMQGEEELDLIRSDGNRPLSWLVARMSGQSSRVGKEDSALLRRACGVRFFLVCNKWWGAETVRPRLEHFVRPIVEILERNHETPKVRNRSGGAESKTRHGNDEEEGKGGEDEHGSCGMDMDGLRVLALSLQEALVTSVGAESYFGLYKELVSKRKAAKNEKKRLAAIQLAIDPERAAKRRRQKAESRAERRRKKSKHQRYGTKVTMASFPVFEKNGHGLREEE